jgi:hypothetical protein
MQSSAATVDEYLAGLPEDRRQAISAVREVILKYLPAGYEEGMQYGAIGYFVPHSIYPPGYHCDPKQPLPFVGLASQKNHMAVYMFCLYVNSEMDKEFEEKYRATGKKFDKGASCVRFKKLDDLPLEVIGEAIAKLSVEEFLASYIPNIPQRKKK